MIHTKKIIENDTGVPLASASHWRYNVSGKYTAKKELRDGMSRKCRKISHIARSRAGLRNQPPKTCGIYTCRKHEKNGPENLFVYL
jgi:hypothetical protein